MYRQGNDREYVQQVGEDYADVVIDWMKTRGYICVDKAVDDRFADIEFAHIAEGAPVFAEAKNVDEGISPNDYRDGLADYFIRWLEHDKQYDFYFFIKEGSNDALWKKLLNAPIDSDEVARFYEKIKNDDDVDDDIVVELKKYRAEVFEDFLRRTEVLCRDYVSLFREARREEGKDDYNYTPYLTSYSPCERPGTLLANLYQIIDYPQSLYRIPQKAETETEAFYRYDEHKHGPMEMDDGYVFSLLSPSNLPETVAEFADVGEAEERDFKRLVTSDDADEIKLIKGLFRGLLTYIAQQNNSQFTPIVGDKRGVILYVEHPEHAGEEQTIDNKWITKEADGYSAVRHRAVEINVKRFGGQYFYALTPKVDFTYDGELLVDGDFKSELSAAFSSSKYPQNRRKLNVIQMWVERFLHPDESLEWYELSAEVADLRISQVDQLKLPVRPPRDGDERDALILNERSTIDD